MSTNYISGQHHRAEPPEMMDSSVPSLKSGLTWGTADDTVLINNKQMRDHVSSSYHDDAGRGAGSPGDHAVASSHDHYNHQYAGGSNRKVDVTTTTITTSTSNDRFLLGDKQVHLAEQGKNSLSSSKKNINKNDSSSKYATTTTTTSSSAAVTKSKMNRSISHGSQTSNAGNKTNQIEMSNNDGSISSLFNYIFCLDGNQGAVIEENSGKITSSKMSRSNNTRSPSKRPTMNKHADKSDAHLLEMALQESKNKGTPRRRHKKYDSSLYVAPSDKLGSLDIVMELQQQEKQSAIRSNNNNNNNASGGKSPTRSPRKIRETRVSKNDNHTTLAAMDEQSVVTDIFDFDDLRGGSGTDVGVNPSSKAASTKGLWIQGSAIGTFQNIATEANAIHPEVANTYLGYRCDKKSVSLVINRVSCSVPLYHHKSCMERESNEMNTSISSSHSGSTDNEETKIPVPTKIKNVCSEPISKLFDVRGPTYPMDGKKIPSDESIFALLGVDNIVKKKDDASYRERDVCQSSDCYLSRLRAASKRLGLIAPFLLVVNFVVPWGNMIGYFYRPDGEHGRPYNSSRKDVTSEKLWDKFIVGDTTYRNSVLKFIPRVVEGPWALKKLVGTQPAMIGQKIPTSYFGSLDEGYLEICIDVTKGGKMANNICNAVASKSSLVSIDLAFLLQGDSPQKLPEQLLFVMRLHHVRLKKKSS